jgi:hypothetical protein
MSHERAVRRSARNHRSFRRPGMSPWVTELVHAIVSLVAVLLGRAHHIYIAKTTFTRQAQQAERAELERHRKEALRERLAFQREVYAEYLRLITKHQADGASMFEGVAAAVERRKREPRRGAPGCARVLR